MQSRRDQVQAYFFVVGRLVAGLAQGKPDVLEHPNRRFNNGTVFGVLLACVIMAVFGIIGLFSPRGNNSWRTDGAIVLTKETGARYVYLGGELRPVLNMASAMLAAGQSGAMTTVSQNSLAGVAVGAPIGIPGAPDGIPTADRVNKEQWTVCARPPDRQAVSSTPTVTLRLDQEPGQVLPDDQSFLVSTPDGVVQVVWRGVRHRVADATTLEALGYSQERVLPVSPAWLNVIPAGVDLKAPVIDRVGTPGQAVGGRPSLVGQVFEVRNPAISSDEYYVLRADGLMPISRTIAAMLLASAETRNAYPNTRVVPIITGPDALVGLKLLSPAQNDLPPSPPAAADVGVGMSACARFDPAVDEGRVPRLVLVPIATDKGAVAPAGKHVVGSTADRVVFPAGTGALVRSLSAPGAVPGTEFLVTDLGVRYPLSDESVSASLNLGGVRAVAVPSALLALLPTGPALDPQRAVLSQVTELAKTGS
ncbi:type VII secretion protein EccB [Lentzea sp. NBC_00516]|uniref:type VII secretion protein EccB n=1 Tax=Lentzea sp. NBC_00516 TaxID=2903582 RepID=UPI002E805F59|nr:type VII secretion protein EccB [Lentzea sp. NBC_00516]WUD28570.1 type VII secretion protein EccB [Lentzea sp. NBC_00516]